MICNKKSNASHIKAFLIDYWLEQNHPDLIINEVPFFKGSRRADLVIIEENKLIGFEIKSELDSLKNLKKQIDDYIKIFDIVYVVIDKKFIQNKELNELPNSVGIIIYDKIIKIKKKPKQIKKFKKSNLISLLWRKDLETLLNNKKLDFDILQKKAQTKLPIRTIKNKILISLKERYGTNYKYFLLDRGNYTTVEDLRIITRINYQTFLF